MKINNLILYFGVLFFVSCVTPNKMKSKAELDKTIVNNLEKELIIGDTLIFESFPLWCANTSFKETKAYFSPIEHDSNFMLQIEKQLSNKIYFSNINFNSNIDSSYKYFKCEGELRNRNNFNSVDITGKCISRRKIMVNETYRTNSKKNGYCKTFKFKNGSWKLIEKREFKQ